jgi:hypothetical protein
MRRTRSKPPGAPSVNARGFAPDGGPICGSRRFPTEVLAYKCEGSWTAPILRSFRRFPRETRRTTKCHLRAELSAHRAAPTPRAIQKKLRMIAALQERCARKLPTPTERPRASAMNARRGAPAGTQDGETPAPPVRTRLSGRWCEWNESERCGQRLLAPELPGEVVKSSKSSPQSLLDEQHTTPDG